ncbi:MAG: hypothetical protein KJN63_07765 [Acidimicrobiia bacterium]|nr:hypothetical protein [Acidimicrobiia bacterium]
MRGPQLAGIALADRSDDWEAVGFEATDGVVSIGALTVSLGRAVEEPQWWFEPELSGTIHGISNAASAPNPQRSNPNGADAVDHIVVTSPNLATTTAAFEEHGFELRRSRPAGSQEQRFFWAGTTIIEVVGPAVPTADGPAQIWGIALVTPDLDASKALLGERLSDPKDAVQTGRRIAAIRTGQHNISITIALMSPHW